MSTIDDEVTALLMAARMLITEPEAWAKHYFAYTADGEETSSYSPNAVCWCALGAIAAAGLDSPSLQSGDVIARMLPHFGGDSISKFNDTHTHAEVLAAFDRAIEQGA